MPRTRPPRWRRRSSGYTRRTPRCGRVVAYAMSSRSSHSSSRTRSTPSRTSSSPSPPRYVTPPHISPHLPTSPHISPRLLGRCALWPYPRPSLQPLADGCSLLTRPAFEPAPVTCGLNRSAKPTRKRPRRLPASLTPMQSWTPPPGAPQGTRRPPCARRPAGCTPPHLPTPLYACMLSGVSGTCGGPSLHGGRRCVWGTLSPS